MAKVLPLLKVHPRGPAEGCADVAVKEAIKEDSAAPTDCSLRVGDLAKLTGKSVRALHLYEEMGLLPCAERSKGGYRLYSRDAVVRVQWIAKLQTIGLSLPEIRDLAAEFAAAPTAPASMARLRTRYAAKLDETRIQIRALESLAKELESSLAYLETCVECSHAELAETACNSCDRHEAGERAPDLVLALHARERAPQD